MRLYQLVSSPETHGNEQTNTLKMARKELHKFIILGGKIRGEIRIRKSDKMRLYQLISSPETKEKKSANKFKTVRTELERFIIPGQKKC